MTAMAVVAYDEPLRESAMPEREVLAGSPSSEYRLPSPRLVLGEIEVVGSRYAHRDDLQRAVALVAAGTARPIVGMVRPLEGVNEVFEALTAGDVVGRAVLDVAGETDRVGS